MADLGAMGVRVDDYRLFPGVRPAHGYLVGPWLGEDVRAMTVRWVPFSPDQLWWQVPDPAVMPRLLEPYRFDNLVGESLPWLTLVYGESWYTRPRPLREPSYALSFAQGDRVPWYPEDLLPVQGRVSHPDLSKVGVCLYGWGSRLVFGLARPGSTGLWRAEVPPGWYGITYQADGAQPVTHGPYQV